MQDVGDEEAVVVRFGRLETHAGAAGKAVAGGEGGVVVHAEVDGVVFFRDGTDEGARSGGIEVDVFDEAVGGVFVGEEVEFGEEVVAGVVVGEGIAGYAGFDEGCAG